VNNIEIDIRHACKSFGDRQILHDVNLSIYAGDTIAIVGGSGCGKTVLLNLILGQYPADEGEILIIDHDIPNSTLTELSKIDGFEIDNMHKHWGVVFQKNALFSGSVLENIGLWLREVKGLKDEQILPIAKRVLADVHLPTDDKFLTRQQNQLSGGMAKRLAIARALAMKPVVLFYDEPTTGLDPVSSAQIHDLIYSTHNEKLSESNTRTTIIITHDKDLLSRLRPRTIMLHEGSIYFDGSFDDFQNSSSPIIRPYFDLMPILNKRQTNSGDVV
jgi:phospholipid/cholesterol/gamma-HCH transport system ATP-binding protein